MADINEKTTGHVKSAKSSNGSVSSAEVLMYEGKIFTHDEYPRNPRLQAGVPPHSRPLWGL